MMYEHQHAAAAAEQQPAVGHHQQYARRKKGAAADGSGTTRRAVEAGERLEIVDLSGLSLDTLPSPSLNLGIICKLDLSNNNLQVCDLLIYALFTFFFRQTDTLFSFSGEVFRRPGA